MAYKQCPNGHYYDGDHCPYCKGGDTSNSSNGKTQIYGGMEQAGSTPAPNSANNIQSAGNPNKTVVAGMDGGYGRGMGPTNPGSAAGQRTVVGAGERTVIDNPQQPNNAAGGSMAGRTQFFFDDARGGGQPVFRETRKFVGWLVSYTLDPMGVDFKLYEGRNIIGRDMDCNITINDNMVSSKHAVLLFRAGKYSLTDSQSSHGTFVNGTDIELEPYYLQDGDEISIGNTMLKFRSSL